MRFQEPLGHDLEFGTPVVEEVECDQRMEAARRVRGFSGIMVDGKLSCLIACAVTGRGKAHEF